MEIKVPDIGGFKDVPVIEIHVKPGDTVKAEDALITLESDKATMDVPSPAAGIVKEVRVKLGDKVSEGTVIVSLEPAAADTASAPAPAPQAAAPAPLPAPTAEPVPAAVAAAAPAPAVAAPAA
ncbi:MAG: biotin/lipoyl-binding protein, partial [Rhodocyclaceae bacterium]|nr:biotin/lipoyl-binding protein [Rhodocyclaceae bacterium]